MAAVSHYPYPTIPPRPGSSSSSSTFSFVSTFSSGDDGETETLLRSGFVSCAHSFLVLLLVEDATVTITSATRTLTKSEKQRSVECVVGTRLRDNNAVRLTPPPPRSLSYRDLRVLAISAQITEISYSISDIQTRIFGGSPSRPRVSY